MKRSFTCLLFVTLAAVFVRAGESKNHRIVDPDTAYKNNCMRCHAAIQQYSPRMTKTIIMHMRVRANLSEDQARAILEYLNGKAESALPEKNRRPNGNQARQGGQ